MALDHPPPLPLLLPTKTHIHRGRPLGSLKPVNGGKTFSRLRVQRMKWQMLARSDGRSGMEQNTVCQVGYYIR